ncbi:MAG: hypothetical protein A2Y33_10620 [Spirochaetes bacterium GWF1_51_8]|nr:MAG: hypothetical protein A2Y33_10620 [Spirochaetes bacterium GWF1_51_8]
MFLTVPALLAACTTFAPTGGNNTPTDPNTLSIQGFAFLPNTVTILTGTTLTWENKDSANHTVTSTTAVQSFDSGALAQGAKFSFKFTAAGTNNYFCSFHPAMTGKVIVTN